VRLVGTCGEIGRKVQKPRHNIAVEKPTRERQRRLGQNEEKAGNKEVRQALQIIQLDSPDALDALVRLELLRIREVFANSRKDSLGRSKKSLIGSRRFPVNQFC
jgi:hypothetical protein